MVIWSIIVITFYVPIVMKSSLGKKVILTGALSLPYIATLRPFAIHYKDFLSKKPYLNFNWPRCMLIYDDPKIKNTEQKPIRAYDLKCSENQTDRMQNVGKDVVNRLYYTQFALFFFFFIYKRSLSYTKL